MKRRHRQAAHRWRAPNLKTCPTCEARVPGHIACPSCGFYKERQVLEIDAL